MTRPAADTVIVGGGVIGCALAAELAARGSSVTVVERGDPGGEASSAAAGKLSPQAGARAPSPFFALLLEDRPHEKLAAEIDGRLSPEISRAVFRNGILLAPITARLVADALTGGPVRDLSAFSLNRFCAELRVV